MSETTHVASVRVQERGEPYAQTISARHHVLAADEPASRGGKDAGPKPYELLLAGLGACTSITLRLSPENRTRLPLDVGCNPSPASIMPAFTSCSLYFPIASMSSLLGGTPASESFVAFTITMTRIVNSPNFSSVCGFVFLRIPALPKRRSAGSQIDKLAFTFLLASGHPESLRPSLVASKMP